MPHVEQVQSAQSRKRCNVGNPKGFLSVPRAKTKERPVEERIKEYREFTIEPSPHEIALQASRCMECGIPFCHQGCPLGNVIPEWNDLVYRGKIREAVALLHSTNNFPEVTGRVCPAPCEASCVLNLNEAPVTIKDVERTLGNHARANGFIPEPARARSGFRVAVVGSGPAGLAAAQEIARRGHDVTVFEKDDRVGGLLRYGIPDFKLEKKVIDERMEQMGAEGVTFKTSTSPSVATLRNDFDAVVIAIGARVPRELAVSGRELRGIHVAMDFLTQQNRRVAGDTVLESEAIDARGKHVVVIGGGDTGSDCVGTSIRQGAASVVQLELMPKPELVRMPENPWPEWPLIFRTSSSQEEGCERDFSVMTRAFIGDQNGHVSGIRAVRAALSAGKINEVGGSEFEIKADLVLFAMGFTGPERAGLVAELGVSIDARGNIVSDASGHTSVRGVFAAGDASRGQSLVVWAIADGRRVAEGVEKYLQKVRREKGAA